MNLELLTKLVKLANNNPNENEANLAARKVCKMIEEAKFQFTKDIIPPLSKPNNAPWVYNPKTDPYGQHFQNNQDDFLEMLKNWMNQGKK